MAALSRTLLVPQIVSHIHSKRRNALFWLTLISHQQVMVGLNQEVLSQLSMNVLSGLIAFFPPNDIAQHVIVVANLVVTVVYSRDCCCQRHLEEIGRPDWK